jgi:hypothetical protein
VILRYDEAPKEVVGLTLIGLRARLMKGLSEKDLAFLLLAPVVPLNAENCKQEPIVSE